MFRPFFITTMLLLAPAGYADTFTADPRVDTVTLYPGLATVTRQITLDLPAGSHDIIVPDLPAGLSPQGLRVSSPAGTLIGAVNLAKDRLPVTPDPTTPAVVAAKAEVERLEEVLRASAATIAQMRLPVRAAEEQVAFLQSLSQAGAGDAITASGIADIRALAQMVGAETLALRQAAFAAEQEALAAERAREDDIDALADARQTLAALIAPTQDGAVLTFTLNAETAGAYTVDISTQEGFATWAPVYDMRLTTGDDPMIDIDRAVVISQQTGQDWTDVQLVLSTARPGEQTAPSMVWPQPRRIVVQEDLERARSGVAMPDMLELRQEQATGDDMQQAMAAPAPMTAQADFSGATVTYRYPRRVDIRNGVDDLRLPLDTLSFAAQVWAEAVPQQDSTAYRMAEFANATGEILLPGQALLYADGTMIGLDRLPLLAAGADHKMGFGPLDGLRLTYEMPQKSEGDTGVFRSANRLTEQVLVTVENLTGQDWSVLLRDTFGYTEQDDLELDITARPPVARRNPEGRRGILEWDLQVAAGAQQDIVVDYTLTWPEGFVLR